METSHLDLAPITRHLRAKASSNLLVAAVHHLNVLEQLINENLSITELQQKLNLRERPAMVLFPALCAMGILKFNPDGKLQLTDLGMYLTSACPVNLTGYTGLENLAFDGADRHPSSRAGPLDREGSGLELTNAAF